MPDSTVHTLKLCYDVTLWKGHGKQTEEDEHWEGAWNNMIYNSLVVHWESGEVDKGNKVDKGILTQTFKKYQLSKNIRTKWINSYMWFIYNFRLSWILPHIS